MDVYTRAIRGWELSRHLDQALTDQALTDQALTDQALTDQALTDQALTDQALMLAALQRALGTGHLPRIHHSDQGVQYAATAYVACLEQMGAQVSMAEPGEPRQNGSAERLMRTIKEQEVALTEYRDCADAYAQIGRFLDEVYQPKRIHSALGYLTPTEFEADYFARQFTPAVLP
jgi:putative transposase